MQKELKMVRDGEVSFDVFARATMSRWQRLGRHLLARYRAPSSVSADDLVQELLLGAWQCLPKWEEGKAGLERYVVFQAMTCAKRWLHQQRGANLHRGADNNPSRFELLSDDGSELEIEVQAAQERVVQALERLRLASTLLMTEKSRTAFAAVAVTGSVDGAMAYLAEAGYPVRRRMVTNALREAARLEV